MLSGQPHLGARGYISRLSPSSPGPSHFSHLLSPVQLLSSLTECLTVDPLSASVWRQLYPKHLSQSRQVGVGGRPRLIHAEKPSLFFPTCPSLEVGRETLSLSFRFMPLKLSGNFARVASRKLLTVGGK